MRSTLTLLLAAVAAMPAHAAIVTYQFTATVATGITEKSGDTGLYNDTMASSMAGPLIRVGDIWTGTISYDTNLTLTAYQPEPLEQGSYRMYEGIMRSTLTDARTGLSYGSNLDYASMLVYDSIPGVSYDALSINTNAVNTNWESVTFSFFDSGGGALTDSAPPRGLNAFDYDSLTVSYSFWRSSNSDWMQATADITSLALVTAPVPEPSTYAMLGLGLAALAMTKRFRHA